MKQMEFEQTLTQSGNLGVETLFFSGSVVVTVGFCVKDMADIVGKALRSVINQDFPHASFELLVVEGFSTDGTFSIIKEYLAEVDFDYSIFNEFERFIK